MSTTIKIQHSLKGFNQLNPEVEPKNEPTHIIISDVNIIPASGELKGAQRVIISADEWFRIFQQIGWCPGLLLWWSM